MYDVSYNMPLSQNENTWHKMDNYMSQLERPDSSLPSLHKWLLSLRPPQHHIPLFLSSIPHYWTFRALLAWQPSKNA